MDADLARYLTDAERNDPDWTDAALGAIARQRRFDALYAIKPAMDVQMAHTADVGLDPTESEPLPRSASAQPVLDESRISTSTASRSLSIPAHPLSLTDQIACVLDTFAPGEEMPVSDVLQTLHQFGLRFSPYTLREARQRVGIQTRHDGISGNWYWYRPE